MIRWNCLERKPHLRHKRGRATQHFKKGTAKDSSPPQEEDGTSDGTRTRGLLRDRRSNQLNYAPAYYVVWSLPIPSRSLSFLLVPSGRAVTGQRSVDNRKSSQTFSSTSSSNTDFFSADPDAKHICIASNCPKDSRKPPGINFSRYIIIHEGG